MSSKGCGFQSADIGVFTKHQSGRNALFTFRGNGWGWGLSKNYSK